MATHSILLAFWTWLSQQPEQLRLANYMAVVIRQKKELGIGDWMIFISAESPDALVQ